MRGRLWTTGVLAAVLLLLGPTAGAVDFENLESEVKEFTLPNGLTFLVLERHDAPVFSFRTYVNAGGVDEVPGVTGIAHMFEHMAFKGTESIGTTDYKKEKVAIAAVDAAWDAYSAEEMKEFAADSTKLTELREVFETAKDKAQEFVVSNEFAKLLEENGVRGLNAGTGTDFTMYLYSLPSNRLELWARLEGDRLTNPVLREFYIERDVVIEERRFQESSPTGRLFNELLTTGFTAHPYGTGIIGFASDLERITRDDARDFFDRYYVSGNMTIALVGDVDFEQVKEYAEKYFSDVPTGPKARLVRTKEPRHEWEIRITREEDSNPVLGLCYLIPGRLHPDWWAYELLGDMMGTGRSSRLYERAVKRDKIASQAGGGVGLPGEKYPNMMILFAFVSKDATALAVEAVFKEEVQRMVDDGPTQEELDKVKSMNKAALIRSLRSNSGLAGQLAEHQMMLGDWRMLFQILNDIDAVTLEDVHRAAKEAFRPGNAVVAMIKKPVS